MKNEQIIEEVVNTKKGNKVIRKAKVISKIVTDSGKEVLNNKSTHKIAGVSALFNGLITKDVRHAGKGAAVVLGCAFVTTTIFNIMERKDEIKEA